MTTQNNGEIKKSIRQWWADYPMTYGDEHGETTYIDQYGNKTVVEIGSKLFFEQADQVFYGWNSAWHGEKGKFSKLFDYERYAGKPVLEVGCGLGCMAMNWAKQGAKLTAVDLNPVAIQQTRKRFEVFGLNGDIREADGESLPFEDNSFDFVYSWGVLHHSPNLKQSIGELYRVLKPGGRVGVMLYHRDSLWHKFITEYVEGFLNLEYKFLTPLELASRYGDGYRKEGNPHTWPVTKNEVRREIFAQYQNLKITVLGTELLWIFNQWYPGLGRILPKPMMNACIKRWGWSLWITGEKAG